MREKERILLLSVSGSSDITNKACSPFGFHFNCDTFALARSTGGALTKSGADTWFFITVDYAFGHALERDTTRFVNEAGGKVLGSVPASAQHRRFFELSPGRSGVRREGGRVCQCGHGCSERYQAGQRVRPSAERTASSGSAVIHH